MLGGTLATIHNLYFINALFVDIRAAIASNTFSSFKESFLARYTTSNV
jgi:tRNA-guanine family transglycosylase